MRGKRYDEGVVSCVAKAVQPVILVWVNTQKERSDGTTYEDLLHPEVWWERLDV